MAAAGLVRVHDGTLVYVEFGNETNDVAVAVDGGAYVVTDVGARVAPGEGCRRVAAETVRCVRDAISDVAVQTGVGNDAIRVSVDVPATLDGGPGSDDVSGGSEDDTLVGGTGADRVAGGAGTDIVSYADRSSSVFVTLDGVDDDGAPGEGDSIAGDVEIVLGGSGNDRLVGGSGNGELRGGPGDDTVIGGTGWWNVVGDAGNDVVTAGQGYYYQSADGGTGDDVVNGSDDRDYLYGGDGNDVLNGGAEADALIGGAGADVLHGGDSSIDYADYQDRTASLSLTLDGLANDGEVGESDEIADDTEGLLGGAADDVLVGNAGNNNLNGLGGDDRLDGGLGMDGLTGGDGFDTVDYSSRTNPVYADFLPYCDNGERGELDCIEQSVEKIVGGAGDDVLGAYSKYDGHAVLVGGPGNDWFNGSSWWATTTMIGGTGADTFQAQNSLLDDISCGDDVDAVTADASDTVAAECERVQQ